MSGIVGILNLNGAPIDPRLLRQMTDFMTFRGPDAQQVWSHGSVGFGHTLLRTTDESADESQPFTFDDRVWIVADARIDAREDLVRKLNAKGRAASLARPDVELILHAYLAWGEDCVDHLIGDFAFAIWNEPERKLFCARDHFGVKPFYYAHVGDNLVVSNTLNCVRVHPAVSDELNEMAIADFLLFGNNQEVTTSAFADIQRLPPAHCLAWSDGTLRLRRYWSLPSDVELKHRRAQDVIAEFKTIFRAAVKDRLRTPQVGIPISGGLDSSYIAAVTRDLLAESQRSFDLRAFCSVYDHLIPDNERHFSGLVAERLGIPINYVIGDEFTPYEQWDHSAHQRPEPFHHPLLAFQVELIRRLATHSRVALTGWDGDAVLCELLKPHYSLLVKERKFGMLAKECLRYVWWKKQPPPIGVRTWLRNRLRKTQQQEITMPQWLNPDFAERLKLDERWAEMQTQPPRHRIRPTLYFLLNSPAWPQLFEEQDAEAIRYPLEFRHPMADLRLVSFMQSVPPSPWLVSKELLRASALGVLPEVVRRRPKSPVVGDPVGKLIRLGRSPALEQIVYAPALAKFVTHEVIPSFPSEEDTFQLWMNLRPLTLSIWLQNTAKSAHHPEMEKNHVHRNNTQSQFAAVR